LPEDRNENRCDHVAGGCLSHPTREAY
jgi:hypothetical protein